MPSNDPFESLPGVTQGELTGKFSHAWVEESLISTELRNNPFSAPRTKKYIGLPFSKTRLLVLMFFLFGGLGISILRIGYLQLWQGTQYRQLAEGNRLRLRPIPAERGVLYDRFHVQLVQNVPSFSLSVTPNDIPRTPVERANVINYVASVSRSPTSTIVDFLEKYKSYSFASLVVKENVDYQSALSTYIQSGEYPGVTVESGTKRLYTYDTDTQSLSHILGYISKLTPEELSNYKNKEYLPTDNIGKTGLEKTYESVLRGTFGRKKVEVNASGRELSTLAFNSPIPGKNLILTIDLAAQQELEKLIHIAATKLNHRRIAAVAMNPYDGSILAIVSWPAYNNNDFSGGVSGTRYALYSNDTDQPLFNRAISGTYPSGSIIKLIVSAAALNEGVITRATTILSTGGIQVGPWFFKDWKVGGHGVTDVFKAVAWSVNSFFYYIGGGYKNFIGLGLEKLTDYYRRFGLGSKTGIDLPSESAGFVPSSEWKLRTKGEKWYIGDTYNISIGQGDILVTPLQAAVWTAAIANGGTVVTPHLVQKIQDPDSKNEYDINPRPRKTNIISASSADTAREAAKACVTYGSCQRLKNLPFTSGGKTGTAQWSSTKDTHAWFTAFAPFDKPQVVITVLIEEGGEGGIVSIPIARDFLAWWGKKYLTH